MNYSKFTSQSLVGKSSLSSLRAGAVSMALVATLALPTAILAQSANSAGTSTTTNSQLNTPASGTSTPGTSSTTTTATNNTFWNSLGDNAWWLLPAALIVLVVAVLASSGGRTTDRTETYRSDVDLSGARGGEVTRRRVVETDEDL